MIQIVEGRGVGAGKTCYVVTRVINHLASGGTVYYSDTMELLPSKIVAYIARHFGLKASEDQMVAVPRADVWRIHEVTPPGTDDMPVLIVLDEAQRALNARDWNDPKKRALFDWACESRHDNNDLIFISQNALNIDKQIARLTTYIIRVRNMCQTKIAGFKWPFKQFMVKLIDGDGKTEMERFLVPFKQDIFDCYVSKSMGGSHKRLHGAITRKKLEKIDNKKRRFIVRFLLVVLVVALLGAGFCGYKLYKSGGILGPAIPVASAGGSSTESKSGDSGAVKAAYTVVRETYRMQYNEAGKATVLVTQEGGNYIPGEMSVHGMCEGVKDRIARIKDPFGALVYVVAVEQNSAVASVSVAKTRDVPPTPLGLAGTEKK